jgi:mono/diheme cytochrome c family protein
MIRRVLLAVAVFACAAGVAGAQTTIKRVPITPTPADDAPKMFQEYCAVCHGADAKGGGPAAVALKKAPSDLTAISARNGGTFPQAKIARYLEGLDSIPAHGTREMPIWGELFRSLDPNTVQIRVKQLSEYLKSLQK